MNARVGSSPGVPGTELEAEPKPDPSETCEAPLAVVESELFGRRPRTRDASETADESIVEDGKDPDDEKADAVLAGNGI